MTQTIACSAGIDISKDHLDVHIHPAGSSRRYCNDERGWQALVRWLEGFLPGRVVYEATGLYHRGIERALASRTLPIVRVNPRRARRFAEAIGTLAKTDRVDAAMLALYGMMLAPEITRPSSQALESLRELEAARRALVKARTAQTNRAKNLTSRMLMRQAKAMLRTIERQITEIDNAADALITADPELAQRAQILTSIPGLGPQTALVILCLMPELGSMDERQAASLAGLAPVARDSGKHKGKRFIQAGRAHARQALYMPALVAIRFNPDMKRKYQQLIDAGKPAKVAITAIMRKLIVLANTLLRQRRKWQDSIA